MVNLVTTVQNPPWPLYSPYIGFADVHSYFKLCYIHILKSRLFMGHFFWHTLYYADTRELLVLVLLMCVV